MFLLRGLELCWLSEFSPMSLDCFLLGTLDPNSALRLLRGQSDVLRIICTLACEERWDLHIERFPHLSDGIPLLTPLPWHEDDDEGTRHQFIPLHRKLIGGCAIATIEQNVVFPPVSSLPSGTLPHQQDDILYVNMMPFSLKKPKITLPPCCHSYLPLINSCLRLIDPSDRAVGYLSIDERPVPNEMPQRRGGLHVESPGVLPILGEDNVIQSGMFVPGIEHGWGNGLMLRSEYVHGGIFLGSNVAGTTAVWNTRVRNDGGDIVGSHGSIERCRDLLGPPTRSLEAGEIIWMTDKTPHESLPLPSRTQRRQFFRLVIGEVTAWFADHSTPNPTGFSPPSHVRIVYGNKYELYNASRCKPLWICGTHSEITSLRERKEVRELYHALGVGHRAEELIKIHGFDSLKSLILEAYRAKSLRGEDDLIDYLWDTTRITVFDGEDDFEFKVFAKILNYGEEALVEAAEESKGTELESSRTELSPRDIDLAVHHLKELVKLDEGTIDDYW
jgi:hypothetical protein